MGDDSYSQPLSLEEMGNSDAEKAPEKTPEVQKTKETKETKSE